LLILGTITEIMHQEQSVNDPDALARKVMPQKKSRAVYTERDAEEVFSKIGENDQPPLSSLARSSSLVLCFLRAAVRVSIASMGFKSTIIRRSFRTASM
jgi:galactokinase/mevalonate kinase-like predicted kinase